MSECASLRRLEAVERGCGYGAAWRQTWQFARLRLPSARLAEVGQTTRSLGRVVGFAVHATAEAIIAWESTASAKKSRRWVSGSCWTSGAPEGQVLPTLTGNASHPGGREPVALGAAVGTAVDEKGDAVGVAVGAGTEDGAGAVALVGAFVCGRVHTT